MAKWIPSQEEPLWLKEYPLWLNQIIPTNKEFLRVNDLFEMPNGDLLVWGALYHNWNPIVMRFDSEGNFLSHKMWGHASLNDWLPFPVRVGDEEFIFGYSNAVYHNNQINMLYSKPRGGRFNSQTMQVELWEPFDVENMIVHFVTDTELVGDTAIATLGFGTRHFELPLNIWMSEEVVYIIKSDLDGNMEWYQEYLPPIPHLNPDAWDLEITPDGGFAFVGNFFNLAENGWEPTNKSTWVVKTDACGDVVFNGCPPPVVVVENAKSTGLLLYPNPATHKLNIILPPGGNRAEVYILSGQLVMSQFIYPGWDRAVIDVSGLVGGMYMVRVVKESGEVMGAGRFVRE